MKKLLLLLAALALGFGVAQTYVEQSFANVDTLDPVQAYDSASGQIIENVYENLYGYVGESVTEYEPELATDYQVSDDGLTYTFTLRDGVTFHSGNPFTCADVEYSIERALVTNPADSGAWILAEPLIGQSANANDALGEGATDEQYQDYWNKIDASVECTDDMTVQFKLVGPDPAFLSKLLHTSNSVVDSQFAIQNGEWDGTADTWRDWVGVDLRDYYLQAHMSGTGPYQLVAWEPGIRVVLEASPNYWGERGNIQDVILQQVEDQAARIQALLAGDADYVVLNGRSTIAQVEGQPGVKVYDANADPSLGWTGTTVTTVFMNEAITAENNENIGSGQLDGLGVPPDFFSDVHVRKCFNYAFDPDTYIQDVLDGVGQPLTVALPPSFLGYDETLPTYTLDLEKAEEECRAAWDGQLWDKGMYLTITYNSGNTQRQTVAEILKSNLEFLNPKFTVDVRALQWSDFLAQQRDGKLPVSISGWAPDYADPDNYISTFYASDGIYASRTNYENPEVDALIDEAKTSLEPDHRVELYSQIGQLVYEDAPLIVLPQGVPWFVMRDEVQGVYGNAMYNSGTGFLIKDISK